MFVIWHQTYDKIAPFMSNPNYAPKWRVVENNFCGELGYGTWKSCTETVVDGLNWCRAPVDLCMNDAADAATKSIKVAPGDPVQKGANLFCGSSSELSDLGFGNGEIDLVITDPPFGDNIFYSDLSNFFHAWIRLALHDRHTFFDPEKTPSVQEALTPRLLPEEEANQHYQVRLTACWSECSRVLSDGGLMAFTFHHSEDAQWAIVLESLFDAGFVLEQTFPIASDEQKGEGGQYGAKGTEYDIMHVCRKRLANPTAVSWPKMRQWVRSELKRLRRLLESYRANDISDADIRVILRGKALEFYSQHYGQVFTSEEEVLTIRHALGGINQLLDEDSDTSEERPPSIVQPVAYQYLNLFSRRDVVSASEVSKSLFSTAIRQRDFEDRGWVQEQNKQVQAVLIRDRFDICRQRPRKEMKTEIDQAHFLIGSAMPGSNMDLQAELKKDSWMVRRSVSAVLDWYAKVSPDADVRDAAATASEILISVRDKMREQPQVIDRQKRLFDDWDDDSQD